MVVIRITPFFNFKIYNFTDEGNLFTPNTDDKAHSVNL